MEMNVEQFCVLRRLKVRQRGRVVALTGEQDCCSRMESMGIYVGCDLKVVHSGDDPGSPALIAVGETRLAIGYDMLDSILVAVES